MKNFMNMCAVLVLSLGVLCGTPEMSAQSFSDRFRSAAEKIGRQVKDDVSNKVKTKAREKAKDMEKEVEKAVEEALEKPGQKSEQSSSEKSARKSTEKTDRKSSSGTAASARDRALQKNYESAMGKTGNDGDEAPTVKLPKTHTALFAPLGYPVEARYGVKSAKPVTPPESENAQVAWSEKLPSVSDLDNRSLVEEFVMLDGLVADGYIGNLSPAGWRYHELVKGELISRTEALNEMVELYNEALDEYGMEDTPDWVINGTHNRLAGVLDSKAYKTVIRSSIAPLFTLKQKFIEDATKEYFKAHGGYEGAEKATLTVWDPKPDKESVSSTASGQTGTVVSENASGATVDIGGVIYVLHNKNGKPSSAFISEAVKTAVTGRDIEIPDYVVYKGGKYPVREMRGEVFRDMPIKSVKLPSTLWEIANAAFRGTPITEITIPASVKRVQGSAFYGCSKLAKVAFEGDSIEELHGCFQNCTALKSIILPRQVGLMSYEMFAGCSNLTDVTLPENMTEVYFKMFQDCRSLKKVDIPSSVVKVDDQAFAGSGVTELDLSNVTEFDGFCFMGCKALKTVRLNSSLKADFLMETYDKFTGCPLLEVKYVDGQYVYPAGFIFVDK